MKTGWKTTMVVMTILALVGGLAIAGPGGGPGWGRGQARGRGPGMGPGMGMGMGMGPMHQGAAPMGPGAGGLCPLGPAHTNALGAIAAWLDLTDEQKTQIRTIQEQGKNDAEAAQEAVAVARDALHDAVIGGAAEAEIQAAATTVGEAISNQAVLHAKTVAAVKAVLTDEQKKTFDEKRAERPGLRQRIPHAAGPFCPWADPDNPDQTVQPPMRGRGFGGGPVPTEEIFKAADRDKDGKLTMEELKAFHDTARGGRQLRHQP